MSAQWSAVGDAATSTAGGRAGIPRVQQVQDRDATGHVSTLRTAEFSLQAAGFRRRVVVALVPGEDGTAAKGLVAGGGHWSLLPNGIQ